MADEKITNTEQTVKNTDEEIIYDGNLKLTIKEYREFTERFAKDGIKFREYIYKKRQEHCAAGYTEDSWQINDAELQKDWGKFGPYAIRCLSLVGYATRIAPKEKHRTFCGKLMYLRDVIKAKLFSSKTNAR